MQTIRVLIVDDSPTVRSVLTSILSGHPDIEVVGTASDALEAKDLILAKGPDVITLDIEMPGMDGITFLKRLMSFRAIPVIMISSYTRRNSARTLQALDSGAVDFVAKPAKGVETGLRKLKYEVIEKVRAAAEAKIRPAFIFGKPRTTVAKATIRSPDKIIAVGASTGGTRAIQTVLRSMPSNINSMVVVQHMPARFTKTFAEQLDALFPMEVKEAGDGDRLARGRVLVAPGGRHLQVAKDLQGYYVRTHDGEPVNHQRPSVDVLFHSVAKAASGNAIGILLTGMGNDGTDGLMAMKRAGAFTIAQDEATSVVFGMPGSAISGGAVEVVAALDDIADIVVAALEL